MKDLFLVCNAHLDPVWLWDWEEGLAEAVSTFRIAAGFCEKNQGFVFNHNEALLYRWVEEIEPDLFSRIRNLVARGQWHIMGGWYLQPDCNMPSGESFVRQILAGRRYFFERFGKTPKTAINFDPFGHTRGLVQILAKCGYDSYVVTRPSQKDCPLPADEFLWTGFDGSEILVHRGFEGYNSQVGDSAGKARRYVGSDASRDTGMLLWGIGNHGGGPSAAELADLDAFVSASASEGLRAVHATPEDYFETLRRSGRSIPHFDGSLNPWAVGCYTSQVRIKQRHRLLENELYVTERMMAHAAIQGLLAWDVQAHAQGVEDLLFSQFHDILPGSSIPGVEETSLRRMDHGLEILSRLKVRSFIALLSGQAPAVGDEVPIFVYNPHPFPVRETVVCELQLAAQNWGEGFSMPVILHDAQEVLSQCEQEASNINLDWRKRVVFSADLRPGTMNRFTCRFRLEPARPTIHLQSDRGLIRFVNDRMEIVIDQETGWMSSYRIDGIEYLSGPAFHAVVLQDDDDPWGMRVDSYRNEAGRFVPMSPEESMAFSGVDHPLDPVRVIEDGPVRVVVEALFRFGGSELCQRYLLPRQGTQVEVETRVYWNEKRKMLKLSIPTVLVDGEYRGQTAFGRERLSSAGKEVVAQKWTAVVSESRALAFTCINDGIYGSDCLAGELRLSLLRSPAYSMHPIHDRPGMKQDRFSPRIDQGERIFRCWIDAGDAQVRMAAIEREAVVRNEKPMVMTYYPSGCGKIPAPLVVLDDGAIALSALKRAEEGEGWIIRLYEPTGAPRSTTVSIPALDIEETLLFKPFEARTFRLEVEGTGLVEVPMTEDRIC